MNKLKTNNSIILTYNNFLKNNLLKKRKELKKVLFENQILYKNKEFNIIESNNFQNIYIPITVLNIKNIFYIQNIYKNYFLINFDLNYNILYIFNKILIQNKKKRIKSRIIKSYKKKIYISFLGFIFFIKFKNLNYLLTIKYFPFFNRRRTFKKYNIYKMKKKKQQKIIKNYKLKYLNFKIEQKNDIFFFSRGNYIKELMKLKNKKLKKSYLSEKNKK